MSDRYRDHHDRFRLREHGAFVKAIQHVATAVDDMSLSAPARALAKVLPDYWDMDDSQRDHYCYPSTRTLGKAIGFSHDTAWHASIELQAHGYIFILRGDPAADQPSRKATRYYPRLDSEDRTPASENATREQVAEPSGDELGTDEGYPPQAMAIRDHALICGLEAQDFVPEWDDGAPEWWNVLRQSEGFLAAVLAEIESAPVLTPETAAGIWRHVIEKRRAEQ